MYRIMSKQVYNDPCTSDRLQQTVNCLLKAIPKSRLLNVNVISHRHCNFVDFLYKENTHDENENNLVHVKFVRKMFFTYTVTTCLSTTATR